MQGNLSVSMESHSTMSSSVSSSTSIIPSSKMMKKGTGAPYIPSYMDLTNGPEPCVVCSDAATGYHYRCMTCEGCKGFFRRTIQKNLKYHCKWNNNCVIDKTTRNQCQQCRYRKCLAVGMATDLVLNERQRVAKRRLIEDNRERRRVEQHKLSHKIPKHEACYHEEITDDDRQLIDEIQAAYDQTAVQINKTYTLPECEGQPKEKTDPEVWQQLAQVMTPSIVKVVEFSKRVPGFCQLNVDDQILLLKSCCMEIICLRAACRYNAEAQTLTLQNGLILHKSQMHTGGLGLLVEPIFEFAVGLAKLDLDETEIALLAAVLLMQSDRTGLRDAENVERLQDAVLGAYKRYIAETRPHQPVHWAKILMKVTDLRTISTRHAERVLCIKLDCPGNIPPLFLEMFDEGVVPVILRELLLAPLETLPQMRYDMRVSVPPGMVQHQSMIATPGPPVGLVMNGHNGIQIRHTGPPPNAPIGPPPQYTMAPQYNLPDQMPPLAPVQQMMSEYDLPHYTQL